MAKGVLCLKTPDCGQGQNAFFLSERDLQPTTQDGESGLSFCVCGAFVGRAFLFPSRLVLCLASLHLVWLASFDTAVGVWVCSGHPLESDSLAHCKSQVTRERAVHNGLDRLCAMKCALPPPTMQPPRAILGLWAGEQCRWLVRHNRYGHTLPERLSEKSAHTHTYTQMPHSPTGARLRRPRLLTTHHLPSLPPLNRSNS